MQDAFGNTIEVRKKKGHLKGALDKDSYAARSATIRIFRNFEGILDKDSYAARSGRNFGRNFEGSAALKISENSDGLSLVEW